MTTVSKTGGLVLQIWVGASRVFDVRVRIRVQATFMNSEAHVDTLYPVVLTHSFKLTMIVIGKICFRLHPRRYLLSSLSHVSSPVYHHLSFAHWKTGTNCI